MKVTVKEEAIREFIRSALDGAGSNMPANVNPVVDPSAAATDPSNPNFVPQTKQELDVALRQVTMDIPIDSVPRAYKAARAAINKEKNEKDLEMSKDDRGVNKKVEETVRKAVRKTISNLAEAELPPVKKIPYGVHGDEYLRKMRKSRDDLAKALGKEEPPEGDLPDDNEFGPSGKRKAYKATALGSMTDVSGASFDSIAKDLGLSVAGAKRAVDFALDKAKWAVMQDPDELEILTLQAMNDYINMLSKSGELSAADVKLMKDHPNIVSELDGFREFLHNSIRRVRREGQSVENPLGENKKLQETLPHPSDDYDPMMDGGHDFGAPPCDHCNSENTTPHEPIPSMAGYGSDESWSCNDCGKTSFVTSGGGSARRVHREAAHRKNVNEALRISGVLRPNKKGK